ncbi:MAG TPA: DMT family transporter, partial [Thioalkalivibrio sp.]|nr:DMT family transporter [Thioalkalivibrio sp.]
MPLDDLPMVMNGVMLLETMPRAPGLCKYRHASPWAAHSLTANTASESQYSGVHTQAIETARDTPLQGFRFPPRLALSLASLFWAGNFIVGRALRDAVPAIDMNFWRWLIALAILLPFAVVTLRRHWTVIRDQWRLIVFLSLTGIVGFHLFVYTALQTTTAVNALLFLSVSPVMILVGAWLRYGDPISRVQLLAMAISLAGVVVLVTQGELARLLGLEFNVGDLWMLLAVSLWSAYSVALKTKPADLPQTPLITSPVIIAMLVLTPVYLATLPGGRPVEFTGGVVAGLLYIGVFASVIAYFCWNYGVARLGPSRAGVFLHLNPLFGAVLSILFLDEG